MKNALIDKISKRTAIIGLTGLGLEFTAKHF